MPIPVCPNRTPIMGVDYDAPFVHANKSLDQLDAAEFNAEISPARATGTLTVAGSTVQNDVIRATIAGVQVDVTVSAAPTTSTVAIQLANAINSNASLFGKVAATVNAAVVTVTADSAGFGGNAITLVGASVSGTTTLTAGAATLAGGTIVITPQDNFVIQVGKTCIACRQGRPIIATQGIADAITASGYLYY